MLHLIVLLVLSISAESLRTARDPRHPKDPGHVLTSRTHVNFSSLMNMNKDNLVRFSHIPKSGGTWVTKVLDVLGFQTTEIMTHPHYKCSSYHVPPGEAIGEGDSARFNFYTEPGVESFAIIRHPYDRAVSQYLWGMQVWNRSLGYPLNPDGMNRYLQDALKNASKKGTSFGIAGNPATRELNGPHLQDCHFVPQTDYVFTKDRTFRAIKTLLNFSSIEADLFSFLKRHSQKQPALHFTKNRADLSTESLKYKMRSEFKVAGWHHLLTDKTRDAIDKYYAEDFKLMGFSKYRSK